MINRFSHPPGKKWIKVFALFSLPMTTHLAAGISRKYYGDSVLISSCLPIVGVCSRVRRTNGGASSSVDGIAVVFQDVTKLIFVS